MSLPGSFVFHRFGFGRAGFLLAAPSSPNGFDSSGPFIAFGFLQPQAFRRTNPFSEM
ncbi:hypothetical protein HMPREF9440_01925 [Sutterella parvirubra YIT 11816]|uniref:Uncharacterized protein n=1 Tax=Sutterella parvirubra YIT 11816 TaxID=762967 RepID=H3KGP3_9BURK|nr:hypothetical protein HMPREF9440_01925 [Sutterella parvirubra YIT 11816]